MANRKGSKNNKPLAERDDPSGTSQLVDLSDQDLESLYAWVDGIPLSRPKKNISRDFSDGVLVAEVLMDYFPKLVDIHNYTPSCCTNDKKSNWYTLNRKVFKKMGFEVAEPVISDLVHGKQGTIERFLIVLKDKIQEYADSRQMHMDKPEADQHYSPGRKDTKKGPKTKQVPIFKLDKSPGISPAANNVGKGIIKPAKQDVIPKKRVGRIMETDMVDARLVEMRDQQIGEREEAITILQAKISRLEHLLHLKDMRIEDLQQRVESSRPTGLRR